MSTESTADCERDAESTRNPLGTDTDKYRTTDRLDATTPMGCHGSHRTVGTAGAFGAVGSRAGPTIGSAAHSDWGVEVDPGTADYRHGDGAAQLRGYVDRGRQRGETPLTTSRSASPPRRSHREAAALNENDCDDVFIHFEEIFHEHT